MHGRLFRTTFPLTRAIISAKRNYTSLPLSDSQRKTIYALSSPQGKAGVGVIRVSGPHALDVWQQMVLRTKNKKNGPTPWKMDRCKLVHPTTGQTLDDGLAVFFKAPASFTTEDVLELHIHSGRAIISSVLSALSHFPFCRPAQNGEFTRRAFEGGRLDLTQVEGLKDLIDAETESQRKLALRSVAGDVREQYESLRAEIIHCCAMVEAVIDFGEDDDIEDGVLDTAREKAQGILHTIRSHLQDSRRGEIMRSGVRLAIFGPPNAGKSSLLNYLVQRPAAIVTPHAGTTRDVLELSLDIGGMPVLVADTAGLRHTTDSVEEIGVERAGDVVRSANITICVLALSDVAHTFTQGDREIKIKIPSRIAELVSDDTVFLLNKADLIPNVSPLQISVVIEDEKGELVQSSGKGWVVSLSNDSGTTEFLDGFAAFLKKRYDLSDQNNTNTPILITHARHRAHLSNAVKFLDAFLSMDPADIVLGAEELRYAAQAVGKVSGLIDVEDVLDALFKDFCIGK